MLNNFITQTCLLLPPYNLLIKESIDIDLRKKNVKRMKQRKGTFSTNPQNKG